MSTYRIMFKSLAILLGIILISQGNIYAGSLTSPGGAPSTTSYTLTDIFNRITTNVTATLGNHSLSPTTTPQSSYHSLTQIYNAIPTIDPGDFLASSTYLGVTGTVEVKTGDTASVISSTSTNKLLLRPPVGFYNGNVTVSTTSTSFTPSNIKNGVFLFGLVGTYTGSGGGAASNKTPLNTGQTLCYNAGGTPIACAGTGQDGETLAGTARSYTDNSDETITDNATGLMWMKCIHGLSGADCTTGTATKLSWSNAIANCEGLTTAGHNDWKLPNINEIGTIVDYGTAFPILNVTYFPNATTTDDYWSSTQFIYSRPYAWVIDFYEGDTSIDYITTGTNFLRCVRVENTTADGQPMKTGQDLCFSTTVTGWGTHRTAEISCSGTGQDAEYQDGAERSYTNNGDSTISDNGTGLMWERCPHGFSGTNCDFNRNDELEPTTFAEALTACANSTVGGYTDWRLPNINEVKSLLSFKWWSGGGDFYPHIDQTYFPLIGYYSNPGEIASATSGFLSPTFKYKVDHYFTGEVMFAPMSNTSTYCVR